MSTRRSASTRRRDDRHRGFFPPLRGFAPARRGPFVSAKGTVQKASPARPQAVRNPRRTVEYVEGFEQRERRWGSFFNSPLKGPKPFPPMRVLFEVPSPPSRIKMAKELVALKQPSPEKSIRFGGLAAPEGGSKCLEPSFPRSLVPFNPVDQCTGKSCSIPVSNLDNF